MTAIVFDLDGTLLRPTRPYRDVLSDAFEAATGEVRPEWVDAYDEAFWDLFSDCEPDPFRGAFSRIDGCPDPDSLVESLREYECESMRPPDGVRADLERLSEEYRLGVLTNGVREWQVHKLRTHGLFDYFDAVVASYEVGAHKPDAAPYRAVEERLPAEAYAMVGDSETDVRGARDAGWTAHRYDGGGFGDLPDALVGA
ncbi:HAD family hydrolase [Halopelagius fulvigenes]|uniref:HAD family hydrolase n=1 Tax=Halopelagius fulvigenes TaxID=1198324 RepID=A0ABD5TZ61_9EURY